MSYKKIALFGALVAAGLVCNVARADELKNGTMMMVMPDGKMEMMPMPDKEMMDKIMKSAMDTKDGMVIMVWGNRLYVLKNEKMPDGKMTFDYWGFHGVK